MKFQDLAAARFSCKSYTSRPVEPEKLAYVLECGRLAPTAKNLQEAHIYVLESPEALDKMDQLTPCRYGAPLALLVSYDKDHVYVYPGGKRDSGVEDGAIVAAHLMLGAADAGLDSCWINNFDPEKAKVLFGLPENEEALMFLDLGYGKSGPLPNHFSRKPVEEITTIL